MKSNELDEELSEKNLNLDDVITQKQFGELVGISQPAVSALIKRGVLMMGQSGKHWLVVYCAQLREQAAGRMGSNGDGDLIVERTRLAKEQADKVALENAVTRREYAPVALITSIIADVGRQIGSQLDAIPKNLKRRSSKLTTDDFAFIEAEIVKARRLAARIKVDLNGLANE